MNHIVRLSVLSMLLGIAAHAQAVIPGSSSQSDAVAGAYAPVATDTPTVQDALNFVQSRIPSISGVRVDVAYVQVVHGWNIKVIGTGFEDGRQVSWKFVVYKQQDGTMHMTMMETL